LNGWWIAYPRGTAILTSILLSRLLLGLRKVSEGETNASLTFTPRTVIFALPEDTGVTEDENMNGVPEYDTTSAANECSGDAEVGHDAAV